MGCDPLS